MRKSTFLYSLLISSTGSRYCKCRRCGYENSNEGSASSTMIETTLDQNPMLAKWSGPYGGIPPFDKIKISDFKPALEAAMEENLNEIKLIADNATPPTFENTIAAMERTGRHWIGCKTIYGIWSSTMNSDEFGAVETEMELKFAAFADKITQNESLFKRIETVYNSPEKKNLLQSNNDSPGHITTSSVPVRDSMPRLKNVCLKSIRHLPVCTPTSVRIFLLMNRKIPRIKIRGRSCRFTAIPERRCSRCGGKKKLSGSWVITNTRSSVDPFLTYSDRRDLREKAWRMFVNRGDNGDEHDNNKIIVEILKLRQERAHLLGYKTHAHWRLENSMAKTPEKAMELMESMWKPAVNRVHEEVADMQALADKEGAKLP